MIIAISVARRLPILAVLKTLAYASIVFCTASATAAEAEMAGQKIALVIGNQNYQHINSLDTPLADTKLVSDSFKTIGFEVTLATI